MNMNQTVYRRIANLTCLLYKGRLPKLTSLARVTNFLTIGKQEEICIAHNKHFLKPKATFCTEDCGTFLREICINTISS
jgi:hypothetical protein